ncbi:MAG: MCE family protein [Rhodospirillaceae bacterium]|nr:MAG: MCE family protein [Rhodospirillaceae bacterium]
MQDSRINYVVVGAFVSAMLVAFVVVISVLAGRTGATDNYYTVYDNVTGIKYGTQVFYEGYQIGQVASIEPLASDKAVLFKVNLEVKRGWRIPEDSLARATVSGLLSAMTVDIRGGRSVQLIAPGGQIKGVSATNFFATLSELGAQFGDLSTESLKPMLNNLNHLIIDFDNATRDRLPGILKDAQTVVGALAHDAPEITASLKRSSALLETDVLKPENRKHIDATLASVDKATSDIATMTAQLDETRRAINHATASIDKIIQNNAGNVDEAIRDMRYTLGTAARYADDIAQNADETSRNLAEFSRALRENPGLIISGSAPADQAKSRK